MRTQKFMQTKEALNRIKWRFGLKKPFKVNFNDFDAINALIDYYDRDRQNKGRKHQLYAKLFIFLFGQVLQKFETTLMDEIPQKYISGILEKPLEIHVQEFTDIVNHLEYMVVIKQIDPENKHPGLETDREKMQKLSRLTPEQIETLTKKTYTYDQVWEFLKTAMTEGYNRFSNG